ncbi:MAG: hypothetical protein OEU50_01840 [Gammaproteobacteria bacterium]|nr:hypothetical protein [Gammaproteobacteria bacterium]
MNKPVSRPVSKRSKVGEVVFLAEKMQRARELSSCCVGTEALLETGFKGPGAAVRGRAAAESKKNR